MEFEAFPYVLHRGTTLPTYSILKLRTQSSLNTRTVYTRTDGTRPAINQVISRNVAMALYITKHALMLLLFFRAGGNSLHAAI